MYTSFYIIWPQGEGNTKALNKKNKRRDPYDYQPQLQDQLHDQGNHRQQKVPERQQQSLLCRM